MSVFCFWAQDPESFLVSDRIGTKDLLGCWQTPGGGMEPGETAHQAAFRELMEETSIIPDFEQMVYVDRTVNMKETTELVPYHTYYFLCKLRDGDVARNMEPHKHGDWVMKPGSQILTLQCVPGLREMIARFQRTREPFAV